MSVTSNQVDIAQLDEKDLPACFQVLSQSFGHDAPFIDIWFPNHDTPSGQVQGSKRLATWKASSASTTFLKVSPPPATLEEADNLEEVWPDKQDREFMSRLWREYVVPRTQAVNDSRGKGVYILELLAVHPEHQCRGAGSKLVSWGTDQAMKLGVKSIVEGTPAGRRVYEKCGFRAEIEEMRFEVGDEFADRVKPKLVFMTKDPVQR
ncbi:hypothetical protein F5Y18DRAFT_424344 [Xylariaceae sp. FL1019]|nr:hypothetical protein F5Y18DRAFT_424344 [Xylariaceae sp. FL1019]